MSRNIIFCTNFKAAQISERTTFEVAQYLSSPVPFSSSSAITVPPKLPSSSPDRRRSRPSPVVAAMLAGQPVTGPDGDSAAASRRWRAMSAIGPSSSMPTVHHRSPITTRRPLCRPVYPPPRRKPPKPRRSPDPKEINPPRPFRPSSPSPAKELFTGNPPSYPPSSTSQPQAMAAASSPPSRQEFLPVPACAAALSSLPTRPKQSPLRVPFFSVPERPLALLRRRTQPPIQRVPGSSVSAQRKSISVSAQRIKSISVFLYHAVDFILRRIS